MSETNRGGYQRRAQKEIHEGDPRRARRKKNYPRRTTKGLEKAQEGSAKGRQGEKGFPRKGKKISTKGHEERRRATKALEEAREGSAKGREGGPRRDSKGLEKAQEGSAKGREGGKDFHEKAKRYPRRATKNGEGPLVGGGSRGFRQRSGRGSAKGL